MTTSPWRRATVCPLCPSTAIMRPTHVGKVPALTCSAGHVLVHVVAGAAGDLTPAARPL